MSNNQEQPSNSNRREQKFYALFATQNGDEFGGDFSLSYRDSDGNLHHTLPWLTPHTEDMKIFKLLTEENVVVMGFKTFESLGHTPLKNRINVVVASRLFNGPCVPTPPWEATQLFFVKTVDEAIVLVRDKFKTRDVFFIGGKKILDDVFSREGFLDGIYHSKIASDWPKANLLSSCDQIVVSTYHIPANVMGSYRLVAQELGMRNGIGHMTVRCSFWKRSSVPQADISVALNIVGVGGTVSQFFQPSLHQESVISWTNATLEHSSPTSLRSLEALKKAAELAKEREVSPENLEALAVILNEKTVDSAVKTPVGVTVRDRSMAIVDPFDQKSTDDQIKDSIKEFIFKELTAKGLTQTPINQPKECLPRKLMKQATTAPSSISHGFVDVATEIGEMLVVKDAAYGSAFEKTKEIFKILFPAGLPVDAYDDALAIMRILDKICRLGVLCTNPEENKTTERSEDAWKDIAGYSIKALCEQRRRAAAAMEKVAGQ